MTDPDSAHDRRQRYAVAIRQRIKDLTGPERPQFLGGGFTWGATEYDLADIAIALADLDVAAERAELVRLLRSEKKRADDAIKRETAAEDAAGELRVERDQLAATLTDVLTRFHILCSPAQDIAYVVPGPVHADGMDRWRAALNAATGTGDAPQAISTCDASVPGAFGQPIGPCVLRHGHDGPVHKAANGATWWPNDQPTGIITSDATLSPAQAEALRTAFPGARIDGRTEFTHGGHAWRYQLLTGAGRCCVCGAPRAIYRNYRGDLFCRLCADCDCGKTPCIRTTTTEN